MDTWELRFGDGTRLTVKAEDMTGAAEQARALRPTLELHSMAGPLGVVDCIERPGPGPGIADMSPDVLQAVARLATYHAVHGGLTMEEAMTDLAVAGIARIYGDAVLLRIAQVPQGSFAAWLINGGD